MPTDALRSSRRLAAVGRATVALGGVPLSMDAIAKAAAQVAGAPVGVVSLVDGEWDRLVGLHGLEGVFAVTRRISVEDSLCRYVISGGAPVWISDTRTDPRSADATIVSYLGLGAFAASPLYGADDAVVGSVCAVDYTPREWTPAQQAALSSIAAVTSLLPGVAGVAAELTVNLLDLAPLLDALAEAFVVVDANGAVLAWNKAATTLSGWSREDVLGRDLHETLFPDQNTQAVRAVLAALTTSSTGQSSPFRRRTVWATGRNGRRLPVDIELCTVPSAAGPRVCVSMLDARPRLNAGREGSFVRAALDTVGLGVLILDPGGRPLLANASLRALLGQPTGSPAVLLEGLCTHLRGPGGEPLSPVELPTGLDHHLSLHLPGREPIGVRLHVDRVTADHEGDGLVLAVRTDAGE